MSSKLSHVNAFDKPGLATRFIPAYGTKASLEPMARSKPGPLPARFLIDLYGNNNV
jgi:hypothetical protein